MQAGTPAHFLRVTGYSFNARILRASVEPGVLAGVVGKRPVVFSPKAATLPAIGLGSVLFLCLVDRQLSLALWSFETRFSGTARSWQRIPPTLKYETLRRKSF